MAVTSGFSVLDCFSPVSRPAFAADPPAATNSQRWVAPNADSFAFDGVLKRNSGDSNGSMPDALLDHWGIVKCYVSPAAGMVLESYLDKEVLLRGATERSADGVTHLRGATLATPSKHGEACTCCHGSTGCSGCRRSPPAV